MLQDVGPFTEAYESFRKIRTGGIIFSFTNTSTATTARELARATRPAGPGSWHISSGCSEFSKRRSFLLPASERHFSTQKRKLRHRFEQHEELRRQQRSSLSPRL